MQVDSSSLFAARYNSIFRDIMQHVALEYTFPGGRGSCKSSFISLCIVLLLVNNKDFNALIIRKNANTLRSSVFEQIIWAIDKLGLRDRFKIPKSQTSALPIIYHRPDGTQQAIIFRGCDNPEKIKSIKIANGYFALLWFEEKTEFNAAEIQNVKVSAMRGGQRFYVFESYNPPSAARHWVNVDAQKPRVNRRIYHTSYLDIPREWLGEAILAEIEYTKATNERAYRNIFLGEPTGSGQQIFENIELCPITDSEIAGMDWLYYGIDWGYFPDPFMWGEMSYNAKTHTLYILDELKLLKHGNLEASKALEEKLCKKYTDGAGVCTYNYMSDRITADSAEPKSIADFAQFGWNIRGAVKGKGSMEAGFKWLQSLKRIVIDPARTPEAADEFSLYEYEIDKRTGEILQGYPQGQPDHFLALARYALESVWRKRGA